MGRNDNIFVRRGESVLFDVHYTPNPDAAYSEDPANTRLYGIPSGGSAETSYTISTSLDEYGNPSDILLADSAGNFNFGLGGLSAGNNFSVKDNGDVLVYDLSGVMDYSNYYHRDLNFDIYTFKADGGFDFQSVDMPEMLPSGASASETILSSYEHTFQEYDDGAFVIAKLESSLSGANAFMVVNIESDDSGQWAVNDSKSFIFNLDSVGENAFSELSGFYNNTNDFAGADSEGIYLAGGHGSSGTVDDLFYIDAALARNGSQDAISKIVDAGNGHHVRYVVEQSDASDVAEIYIGAWDYNDREGFVSSVDFTKGAETISLNSASEVFAIQGGEEIQPNFEIDFSELMILTPGGSAESANTFDFSEWRSFGDGSLKNGVLFFGDQGSWGTQPGYIIQYSQESDGTLGQVTQYTIDWAQFTNPLEGQDLYLSLGTITSEYFTLSASNWETKTQYDYKFDFDGNGRVLEIDDFTAGEPFVYRQVDSPVNWNSSKYYLPDGSQVFHMVNSEPANPLTLEAEGSAEGTWITSSDENWYDHPMLGSLDHDGDGVVTFKLSAQSGQYDSYHEPTEFVIGGMGLWDELATVTVVSSDWVYTPPNTVTLERFSNMWLPL